MIVCIIAGGSGSRLWPLSRPDFPKQLIRASGDKSLLQNTVQRALLIAPPDNIFIITEQSLALQVQQQVTNIPSQNILSEPSRKGTASCVIAALAHIRLHSTSDEPGKSIAPIVFMHADHHITDQQDFAKTISYVGTVASMRKQIILLGLSPTYPATGFGYIKRSAHPTQRNIFKVENFKEKPDHQTAEIYLTQGSYLWNMGYFIATLPVFENVIEAHAPALWKNYTSLLNAQHTAQYLKTYLSFQSEPIDTALIEKVPNLLVAAATFDWTDVGSYGDLHSIQEKDTAYNSVHGPASVHKTNNSYIYNTTTIPLAVIGLDNVAVVATENGILVVNKDDAQQVGAVSKEFTTKPDSFTSDKQTHEKDVAMLRFGEIWRTGIRKTFLKKTNLKRKSEVK